MVLWYDSSIYRVNLVKKEGGFKNQNQIRGDGVYIY